LAERRSRLEARKREARKGEANKRENACVLGFYHGAPVVSSPKFEGEVMFGNRR